jgi:hypothetical protein
MHRLQFSCINSGIKQNDLTSFIEGSACGMISSSTGLSQKNHADFLV